MFVTSGFVMPTSVLWFLVHTRLCLNNAFHAIYNDCKHGFPQFVISVFVAEGTWFERRACQPNYFVGEMNTLRCIVLCQLRPTCSGAYHANNNLCYLEDTKDGSSPSIGEKSCWQQTHGEDDYP